MGKLKQYHSGAWEIRAQGSGSSGSGTAATYLYLTMSANQTTGIADTNPIKFDTHVGDIDFDNATYRATLLAGVTYELSGMTQMEFSGATGYTYFRWWDVTNDAQLGTKGMAVPTTYAGSHIANQPNFTAVVTPVTNVVVEARLDTPTNLTTIYKAYSCAIIKSL
ncbi:MAG: hypothetical protein WC455_28295 [Dehalococcoidia bacterium]|jgi:hypothetical protein